MTLIHNSALQNINLTCGGNCILRKQTSEDENSCGETVSMHSGTDSQYEKISPDVSPVRQSEENLSSDAVIININQSQNSFVERYTPEDLPEGERILSSQEMLLRPEENINIESPQPDENNITSIRRRYPQKEDEKSRETCEEEEKISKLHKKKIKINKRLIPYYYKIKSRLQNIFPQETS